MSGMFMFRVFGGGAGEEVGKPALNGESDDVKRVIPLLRNGLGFLQAGHQWQTM